MQFTLCLLASLLIIGDALQPNFGRIIEVDNRLDGYLDDDDVDFQVQQTLDKLKENEFAGQNDPSFQLFDDIEFDKRSPRLRSYVDNDRGNRDAQKKFIHEMTQCQPSYTQINLYEKFNRSPWEVEFHADSHFNNTVVEVHCIKVEDNDRKRVRNPCAHFPQGGERLCYVHDTKCETVQKPHVIWMRDILPDGSKGRWTPNVLKIDVGCICNAEFHHLTQNG